MTQGILNVAVIGCGIGRSHIEEGYARNLDGYRVLAVCDLDAARMAALADEFGIERRIRDFDAVLAMPEIDVIDICTPPALHREMILKALAAGKHVVCEKPLVGSLAEADEIIAAEKGAKGQLMPIFQYRYGDGAMQAKHLIESGIAGKPYAGAAETFWKRTAAYYDNPWRGRWKTELGGVLMTHAIHMHDIVCFLLGPVSKLFARTATRVNAIEVEDCVSSSWAMESGALFTSTATLGSEEEISRLRLHFEHITMESTHAAYSPGDGPWRFLPASEEAGERIAAALAAVPPVGRRYDGQMRAFREALAAGSPPPVTSADARRALELATAFYHSAATGADVSLPLGPDHPKYAGWRP
ncbi:Gfo/Idh/MocA family protein [Aureimonas leprariae]|uniref:Gfo/Idh/MocA family oxidoreductase n=1 Tax=Plantimonas leprariae TaxID=2615207 RepID=A0A7V7PNH1_9HYPH|nr:Gfo/Idh/MocA family oxidoreductase [Aureimonas leprariae]KAB0679314.1 Gfo/Idh/MocA family oxidoreductase [Aureimonas leprariae]